MRNLSTLFLTLVFALIGGTAMAQGTKDATGTTVKTPDATATTPATPSTPVTPKAVEPPTAPKADAMKIADKGAADVKKLSGEVDPYVGRRHRRHRHGRHHRLAALPTFSAPESNFVDTRISFIFGDDDFLHKAGETIVDSPLPGFGNRNGYELFFDNLNSSRTGRENQIHLVLYKKLAGYIPGLVTEGAIVTKYDFSSSRDGSLKDDGTYMLIRYRSPSGGPELSVTMFPVSTDRFRLGYLYDLTWAGSDAFPGAYRSLTPGIKFALRTKDTYGFMGFKTSRMLTNPPPGSSEGREMETFYAALFGAGYNPGKYGFSVEGNGGFVQMGQNPNNGVEGETVQLFGGSARIAYMHGMKMGMSADLRLFRNDAEFVNSLNARPSYSPGFSYLISAEGNYIMQSLQDPDTYGTTKLQNAYAGAVSAKFRNDFLRGHLTLFSRSVSFILMNVPSYVPYQAFSQGLDTSAELFAAAGVDYYLKDLHLTVGITAGLQFPASTQVQLTATTGASEVDLGKRTVVIRDMGQLSILPEGEDPLPIFGTKLTAKWDLSDMMSVTFMVLYQRDPNYTTLKTLSNGTSSREFESPNKFGAAVVTSAKF
ncbi:hypothetical protein KJ865_03525 [Myxococcota bacterium]|nr:hypothetical protein [Myxococcota bacterium]